MNKIQLTLLLLLFSISTQAQLLQEKHWENFTPRAIGPAGMSGRITAIDVVIEQPEIIYAGTASGGLWRSENGGIHWTPLFDEQKVLSIGAVAVQQNNPDVIWVGTGEGNPRNSYSAGYGIYKSIDGGKTWQCMGLEKTRSIHRVIIHRDNPDIVWVAAMGSAWGPNEERGVYKTTDGGKTWKKVLYNNDLTGCAELVVDSQNPNKLMAAMWQHQRWPWFFKSGGEGSGLYISFDGGESWTKKTEKDGLPKGELGRIGLAISSSNPKVAYALIEAEKTALYRTNDGGFKWNKIADKNIGNRPFYYAEIYVDPTNENKVFNLFSLVTMSEDGGKTFRTIMPYYGYHPDHHAFYIHPKNPNFIINGNDGGMNISRDGGKTWRFVENLPLGQFYHINVDENVPYNVYGGMQDNGSWVGPAYVWKNDGIRNSYWKEVMFGDGFDVMPDLEDTRYGYAMYQGGNVYRYDSQTGNNQYIQPLHPKGEKLRFHWNAAMAQNPFHQNGIYFGSQYVHKSLNKGKSWKIISPDLTTNNPEKQKQAQSGGLTIDATKAENHTTILCIEPSSLDSNLIWVGTDDGNIQVTQDGGKTWKNVAMAIKGFPKEAWIPQIRASKVNAGEAFVVVNNYRQNDWKPYLFYTNDYGKTWKNLVSESIVFGHCLSVIQDTKASNLLFLGTEHGLYVSFDKGSNWQKWMKGFPNVATRDLQIQNNHNDLVAGTFGRAVYVFDDIEPLRTIANNNKELPSGLKVFSAPPAYLAKFASADGVRFAADAAYKGENKKGGAMISFWWDENDNISAEKETHNQESSDENQEDEPSITKEKKSSKDKEAYIFIFNEGGDTIRNYKSKIDTGFNRIYWNLKQNGVHFPSYNTPKKEDNLPSGLNVKPGNYKFLIVKGSQKDSTIIQVNPDPRINFNEREYSQKEKFNQQLESYIRSSKMAVDQLNDAAQRIKKVNQSLEFLPDSVSKKIKQTGKALQDSINNLYLYFMNDKNFEGYDHVTIRINQRLSSAEEYIDSYSAGAENQVQISLQNIEEQLKIVLPKVNDFFSDDWVKFQNLVEQSNPKLFKSYKTISLDEE